MNAEPLIPLPKVRINEAFGAEQLIMLWLIWASGITLGTLVFLFEWMTIMKVQHIKNDVRGEQRCVKTKLSL